MTVSQNVMAGSAAANSGHAGLAPTPDERWPFYDEDEIAAVADILRSGHVNQWTGTTVTEFQDRCTQMFGGGRGIAVANGSLALELALRAFNIGPGDEVVVTPRSFVASASCVRLVGATPIFADVDRDSGNITADTIEAVITSRTKAVIPVHLAGWPADMPAIMDLAGRHGLRVIEDCAQAHGAEIDGRSVGSFGDAAAFSFCQDKIISTGGEGGFTSFREAAEWEWAWSYKDHGKSRAKVVSPNAGVGFRWLHDSIGTNWRLTAPQAALGLCQLAKLEQWRRLRERNAMVWRDALAAVPGIRSPLPGDGMIHAYYKSYAYVDASQDAARLRDDILNRATRAGIRVFSGSCSEVYRERAFDDLPQPDLPVTKSLGECSLMFEVHPTLSPERLARRAEALAIIADDVLG